jgi:hypothetical protein
VRARGFSLWLVPEGVAGARLAARIEGLARVRGPSSRRVTLLGRILRPERDVRDACAAFARTLPAGVDPAGPCRHARRLFPCVFARVAKTGAPAGSRRSRAGAGGGRCGLRAHHSLVYGNLAHEWPRLAQKVRGERRTFVARRPTVAHRGKYADGGSCGLAYGLASARRGDRAGNP